MLLVRANAHKGNGLQFVILTNQTKFVTSHTDSCLLTEDCVQPPGQYSKCESRVHHDEYSRMSDPSRVKMLWVVKNRRQHVKSYLVVGRKFMLGC